MHRIGALVSQPIDDLSEIEGIRPDLSRIGAGNITWYQIVGLRVGIGSAVPRVIDKTDGVFARATHLLYMALERDVDRLVASIFDVGNTLSNAAPTSAMSLCGFLSGPTFAS